MCSVLVVCCAGCKKQSAAEGTEAQAPKTHLVEYTVRGKVSALPSAMSELLIQHEAIPEFRNPDGSLGMNTMQMEFPLGEGFTIGPDIAPGDPVELTFVVEYAEDYKSLHRYFLTVLTELPPDTELDFSPLESASKSEN